MREKLSSTKMYQRTIFVGLLVIGLLGLLSGLIENQPVHSQSKPSPIGNQGSAAGQAPADHKTTDSQPSERKQGNTDSPDSLPPVLISTQPDAGASWDGGHITIVFNQKLDEMAADSFTITPNLPGETTVEDTQLIFAPAAQPQEGVRYQIVIGSQMSAASGAKLTEPVSFSLVAAISPRVTTTQPANESSEVAVDSQIIVVFNRPIVPLLSIDDQERLPDPLSIEPSVPGKGRWINTSTYAFRPDTVLAGATRYSITVKSISAADGFGGSEPYLFEFSTASPIVSQAQPSGPLVRPDRVISVEFSQPMDMESTQAAFSVTAAEPSASTPEKLTGIFGWDTMRQTLYFTPTLQSLAETDTIEQFPLVFGQTYRIRIEDSARSAGKRGTLREPFESTFTVLPLPAVMRTSPRDNATGVAPDFSVYIRFNTHLSRTLLLENISVSPVISTTRVYSYYAEYSNELQLSWFKEPNTSYTITVAGLVEDDYGNRLGDDYTFHFTTGDYSPFVRLESDRFSHFGAYSTTYISLLYRNIEEVSVDLYQLPETEFHRLTGSNQWSVWNDYEMPEPESNRIWSRSFDTAGDHNVSIRQPLSLTTSSGLPLPPGIYFVDVRRPANIDEDAFTDAKQAVIVLSHHNAVLKKGRRDTSLVWLTDLASGTPVPDQPVRFYVDGHAIGDSVTDELGRATAELSIQPDQRWMPVVAIVGSPGEPDFAIVSTDWSQGVGAWDFEIMGGWLTVEDITGYFYTDRPIYRPGQVVNWKGIIRAYDQGKFVLPPSDLEVSVTVRDPLGDVIAEQSFNPDADGIVASKFQLAPEALTGHYYLEARMSVGETFLEVSGAPIQVAAYRKPEFAIKTSSSQESYIQGETVQATVNAGYFSGGPLPDAPVTWRLIADPYFYTWESEPHERHFSFAPFDPDQGNYQPFATGQLGLLREGNGTTDKDGSFTVEIPAELGDALQSQNWHIDFTVQSSTNQFVSDRVSFPVHQASYYAGISPRTNVAIVGDQVTIDLVTISPDGQPYRGADLGIVIYEFQWNNVYERTADGTFRWNSSVERTTVFTSTTVTDRLGEATVSWQPEIAGQYQIVANGVDEKGHHTSSTTFLWISANDPDEYVAWPLENNDRMQLVTDRDFYAPGDMAEILVPSPFSGPVHALLTIERGGVLESKVLVLAGNSDIIEIPITSSHIPNIYVSVILMKGIDETNPLPAMRVGYTHLVVDASEKEIALQIETSAQEVMPTSTVTYSLDLSDSTGNPVANANVSVALVDKSLFSLSQGDNRDLMDVFYYQRTLEVSTGILLVINRDRSSQLLSEGAKGGGGGGDGGIVQVREDFPDIAYWRAELISDDQGKIRFSVSLPDNLTTWTLVARAVTDDTQVGDAQLDIVATKSLQVRPIAPRFLTAGDRTQIGAALVNATAKAFAVGTLSIAVDGGVISGNSTAAVTQLSGGEQLVQTWGVDVDPAATELVVTIDARATGALSDEMLSDVVRLAIPVVRYEAPEMVASAGTVDAQSLTEVLYVPESATDNGNFIVSVEPGLASGLLDGLTYLREFEYACTEQTVSRFLPNLFTVRALRSLNIDHDRLESALDFHLGVGVQRLVNLQNQDGGWGYWPGEQSSVFVTAYALWGLVNATEIDYPVPTRVINDAVAYLERNYQAPSAVHRNWELNEMAFVHYVLSQLGQGDPGRASTLFEQRERLGHYGRALLAMAIDNMNDATTEDPRVQTLLDDLFGAATLSATGVSWQEETIDYRTLNTNTRSTSIVLAAFLQIEPEQPLLSQVVRWLMETRQVGRWKTTQETAWAIISLTDYLVVTGELTADYKWQVEVNNAEVGSGQVSPSTSLDKVVIQQDITQLLRDEANRIVFTRDSSRGRMYYTTYLQYYLDATAISARQRGIYVDRIFRRPEGATTNHASVGDVISVTTTIVAPTDLYQVLVEVPIPAGAEPIDPTLNTTAPDFGIPEFAEVTDTTEADGRWGYWQPTYTDLRDDKLAFFVTYLQAGTYEYTFTLRATVAGEYRVIPVYAEQMYFNEVWGRSAGDLFVVTE